MNKFKAFNGSVRQQISKQISDCHGRDYENCSALGSDAV